MIQRSASKPALKASFYHLLFGQLASTGIGTPPSLVDYPDPASSHSETVYIEKACENLARPFWEEIELKKPEPGKVRLKVSASGVG
jgi:hypothetical protein